MVHNISNQSQHRQLSEYVRHAIGKKHLTPFLVDPNLGYLILEGPGRQTVDTRSTSGLPLKTLGYDGSN